MSFEFDLLGAPYPKRGRRPHIVTDESRVKVILCRAIGRTNEEIAMALGISEPTLRKHYERELRPREEAKFRVEATRLMKLYKSVEEGNVAANKELGKILEKADRDDGPYSFREVNRPIAQKTPKPGKKEEAAIAAQTAGEDSDWGDDLRIPGTIN